MSKLFTALQNGVVVQLVGGNATIMLNDTVVDTACEFVRPEHITTYNQIADYLKHPIMIGSVATYHSKTTDTIELATISGFMNEAVLLVTSKGQNKSIPWALIISIVFPHRKIT